MAFENTQQGTECLKDSPVRVPASEGTAPYRMKTLAVKFDACILQYTL